MKTDKNMVQRDAQLTELVDKLENYEPTWEDLVLEFTPEEKKTLGIEDKEEADES